MTFNLKTQKIPTASLMDIPGHITKGVLVFLCILSMQPAWGKPLAPPDDPTQSITYWKPHTIPAEKDPLVAQTQAVFSVLLRAWDSSRPEPSLYVVDSAAGPWAASLADGNILLSRAAIETCMRFGKDRAEHLLAFVLAHELAHQRSDDLWHQRFFRLIGNQTPEIKNKMLRGLQLNNKLWANVAQKEAQADHDSLILMSSVGYDPYQILDKKDFFTIWVENIWQNSCKLSQTNSPVAQACRQAQSRALRARTQLTNVATQAMLYELGIQAFIAGRYRQARRYFTAYGRNYPGRAVLSALGLSHFAEALNINRQLIEKHGMKRPAFYYPLLLDATASITPWYPKSLDAIKRSDTASVFEQQQQKMRNSIENSINNFEKAIRLEPDHAKSYLLLAFSYLLNGNTYMARGVVQGKYIPKFGSDAASDLLLAMTSALEGDKTRASRAFARLIRQLEKPPAKPVIPADLLVYSAYYNSAAYAEYLGEQARADKLWKDLAVRAKSSGNSLLFRLALNHITPLAPAIHPLTSAPNINGMRLGDRFSPESLSSQPHRINDLWIEGELYHVYRLDNGSRYIIGPDQKIISAWQDAGEVSLNNTIMLGDSADRPLKTLGVPDRRLHMMSGEYLAYDNYGVALHIVRNKIAGWFLYNAN